MPSYSMLHLACAPLAREPVGRLAIPETNEMKTKLVVRKLEPKRNKNFYRETFSKKTFPIFMRIVMLLPTAEAAARHVHKWRISVVVDVAFSCVYSFTSRHIYILTRREM